MSKETQFSPTQYLENFLAIRKILLKLKTTQKNTIQCFNKQKEFREIDKFLLSIDNILLRAELLSDYEVVAQYQTFEFDSIRNINFDKSLFVENANQIALEILRNNFSII